MTSLEEVVVSAGKYEQKLSEVTISMEVIKPSLIENKNSTNIDAVMNQVPGVTVNDGQASIRGGSGFSYGAGSRVLVMVDEMNHFVPWSNPELIRSAILKLIHSTR